MNPRNNLWPRSVSLCWAMWSLGYWKRLPLSKRSFHSQIEFLKGFLPVLLDNGCQQSEAPSRTQGLSEAWWQEPLSILLYYCPFCKFSPPPPLISKLLININRPCQKGAIQELSEELPMHINQLLIYNSYIQLLLRVLRRGRARKTWSHRKADSEVIGNSVPIMSLTHTPPIKSNK